MPNSTSAYSLPLLNPQQQNAENNYQFITVMRLFCPQCVSPTNHKESIKGDSTDIKGLACNSCGHFQPANSIRTKESIKMARRTKSNSEDITPSASPALEQSSAIQPTSNLPISSVSSDVSHGLSLPKFDTNSFLPSDLFTVSSSAPQIDKSKADSAVEAIEKQRHAVRVAGANVALARDVVKLGTEYVRLQGDAIDYATASQENKTKTVKYQTAAVGTQIAEIKLRENQEHLTQSGIQLQGVQSLTPLIREEWEQRIELQKSKVDSVRLSVTKANQKIDADLKKLESSIESGSL